MFGPDSKGNDLRTAVAPGGQAKGRSSQLKTELCTLFARERDFVTQHFCVAKVPGHLVEDQVQDFFVYLVEWARKKGRSALTQEELMRRMEVFLRANLRKFSEPAVGVWECLDSCSDAPRGVERTIDVDFEKAFIDREQVVHYLGCMTEKSQLAVITYYLVGLTREEMAEVWGVSANTAATQAFRGVRQARSFGPWVPPEDLPETSAAHQHVDLPMEWGKIPLELSERSAHLICPWYDPHGARQRWNRRMPLGAPTRPVMLWPQPEPRGRRVRRPRPLLYHDAGFYPEM